MKRIVHPLLLAAVVALGACSSSTSSSGSPPSTDGSTTSTASSTTSASSTSVATSTTAATTTSSTVAPTTIVPTTAPAPPATAAPPGVAPCTVPSLELTMGEGDGAAGSIYTPLVFTNTGSAPCTLDGHPGVSFVDGAGNQIGPSAERTTGPTPTVTLQPGGQAHATLQTHDAGFFGDECVPVQAARLKVYPPDETAFMTIEFGFAVCTGAIAGPQFVIDVVQPGAGA